ncbi:hypothetical protein LVK61_29965, partial [Escherichia coli]|nr:hypothetical protein [Escherichia coli]
TQYVVLIDYNCYYSSPRKRCGVVDKRMAIAESTGKRNEKTGKTPFPISVDNLFLKIWSDHDTACDETRRLQSAV